MNSYDLSGQVAIVTGGAQGIGFAVAERLHQSGASVELWDGRNDSLALHARELVHNGRRLRFVGRTSNVLDRCVLTTLPRFAVWSASCTNQLTCAN